MQGENAWVFVNEEVIADSVKAYNKFNEKLLERYPKEKRKDMKPTQITGLSSCIPSYPGARVSSNQLVVCKMCKCNVASIQP